MDKCYQQVWSSETVNLDQIFLDNLVLHNMICCQSCPVISCYGHGSTHLGQEVSYVFPLVPLDLNHLAKFLILNHSSVAAVFFLQRFENFLVVKALFDALDAEQKLSTGQRVAFTSVSKTILRYPRYTPELLSKTFGRCAVGFECARSPSRWSWSPLLCHRMDQRRDLHRLEI